MLTEGLAILLPTVTFYENTVCTGRLCKMIEIHPGSSSDSSDLRQVTQPL